MQRFGMHNDTTLTPNDIAEGYVRVFQFVHGYEPNVTHMGGYWYDVNGEVVHRGTLIREIFRLREIQAQQKQEREQRKASVSRSLIQRLIARIKHV